MTSVEINSGGFLPPIHLPVERLRESEDARQEYLGEFSSRGLTLTAYITATMGEDARRTIEEADILRLARADQIAFAEALINPPAPNAKLLAAKRRHDELIGK